MTDFELNTKLLIKNDLIEIVSNYKVLHFDDLPILYIGTNRFGNKIIGSYLEEDDETESILNLHTILSNKEYYNFMNQKVSYLEILQNSKSICIVEKDYSSKIKKAYDFDFNSIPTDYLPTNESLCPASVKSHSLRFSIYLKGKLADLNKAIADDVSKIQNGFSEFLEDRIKALKGFDLAPKALLQPYAEGSFKINFELDIKQKSKGRKGGDLFLGLAPISDYISEYVKYIAENFTEDKEIFETDNVEFSESLKSLENKLNELYDKASVKKPNDIHKIIKEDILKSTSKIETLTEQVGENFDSLSILNIGKDNETETPVAFFDIDFSKNFQSSIEQIEISKKGLVEDNTFKDYKIYIYHLNTDNRTGNAFIRNLGNDEEMSKPKIKINGDDGLDQTKFTESLYLNKWIDVKAKAKRIGEKVKSLEIEFEV
jgi:hypothetical protein